MSALDALALLLFLLPPSLPVCPSPRVSMLLFLSRFALVSPFLPSILRSLRRGSSFALLAQERESRMTDSVEALSSGAPTENWKHPIGPLCRGRTIKRYAPPSEPACKICRSVVDPRGTVTRSGSMHLADFAILHLRARSSAARSYLRFANFAKDLSKRLDRVYFVVP